MNMYYESKQSFVLTLKRSKWAILGKNVTQIVSLDKHDFNLSKSSASIITDSRTTKVTEMMGYAQLKQAVDCREKHWD